MLNFEVQLDMFQENIIENTSNILNSRKKEIDQLHSNLQQKIILFIETNGNQLNNLNDKLIRSSKY